VSCSEPASGASARYQRGLPRTRTHKKRSDDSRGIVSHCVTHPPHIPHIPFAVPVSHASHPTIIIQSHRARAVRARGGGGGARRPTRSRPDAGPQDIKTNLGVDQELVSNVACVECAPPRGVELNFREILIFRLRVCAAVVAVSDLCRIYRRNPATLTR
jgi:hypothetical protein